MVDLSAFHPGDKVKVVDKAVPNSYIVYGTMMSGFLGKIVTIQSIHEASYAKIEEDGGRYNWGPAAFEPVGYNEETFDAPPVEDFLASLSALGY